MSQAAAAIFVITHEDISRPGATNIPDLLCMVPGMDVSQINANTWAVSVRGLNDQFSNTLLVLVDGRAVYTPLLGGVNAEFSVNLKLTDPWTLSPGYAFLEMHLHAAPSSPDTTSVAENQGASPQHQVYLRSHMELSRGLSWDAGAFFVSELPIQGVASDTRIATQLKWQLAERAEISLVGQNLLHNDHLESMDALSVVNSSLIKRDACAKFT